MRYLASPRVIGRDEIIVDRGTHGLDVPRRRLDRAPDDVNREHGYNQLMGIDL